ncbi:hypothetical protein I7X12_02020 [Halosimplex litoreum]|uniref:Uncharacterized protein n=1 Tax=Halosimplex litoreum TaxID=1198301 RepID=A0A7T3KW19_9EURY|nr:hypothetical protein [Halosimplex litoreum]QPV63435.1 hypothetical protein I7X12_02020 [Halosimplex litoreum]
MATRTPTTGMAHLTVVPENFGDERDGDESDDESADAAVDRSAGTRSRD